jgi:PAS domain-containing protein
MPRIPAGFAGMHEGRLMIDQPARSARPANDPAEERYREQGRLFDTAVNNMSQGLVMFDAAERLLVCNRRYLEMYGLSPEAVKPGCTLLEMLRHRIAKGTFCPGPPWNTGLTFWRR